MYIKKIYRTEVVVLRKIENFSQNNNFSPIGFFYVHYQLSIIH